MSITINAPKKIKRSEHFEISVSISNGEGNVEKITIFICKPWEEPSIIKELRKTKEEENETKYTVDMQLLEVSEYFFFFEIIIDGQKRAIKLSRETGEPFITDEESPYWIINVTNSYSLDDSARSAIFYQVIPDRMKKSEGHDNWPKVQGRRYYEFGTEIPYGRDESGNFNNNVCYRGDLIGLKNIISYIKTLGVDWIYLGPVNAGPYNRTDGYASINHLEIDKDLGTWDDYKSLCDECEKYQMHVIQDIAFNHFSDKSLMYIDAINNPNSKYKDWFRRDSNGNISTWAGFIDMPEANPKNKDFQEYVKGVIKKYAECGAKGLRLDLFEILDPELQKLIYETAKNEGMLLIVGEAWNDIENELFGTCTDSVIGYTVMEAILRFVVQGRNDIFANKLQWLIDTYPDVANDSRIVSLGTHDTQRGITVVAPEYAKYLRKDDKRIGAIDEYPSMFHQSWDKFDTDGFRQFEYEHDKLKDYELSKQVYKVALVLQYFTMGSPCIFYGDEAGLQGWKDPFCRKCYPWGQEDYELICFFRRIGSFRKKCNLIKTKLQILYSDDELFVYKRENDENSIFVAVNRGYNTRSIEIPKEFMEGKLEVFTISGSNYLLSELKPLEGIVILKSNV